MSVVAMFKNRIVGFEMVAPDQLLANPRNWRIHTQEQKDKMRTTLNVIGWIDTIIVNQRSQNMINGHMRVQIALEDSEPEVPVLYVDLDDNEENMALATFDNLSAMAGTDRDLLTDLLEDIETSDPLMKNFLDAMKPGVIERAEPIPSMEYGNEDLGDDRWLILVTCTSEDEQVELLSKFEMEGLLCRALSTS